MGWKEPLRVGALALWFGVSTLEGQPAATVVNLADQPGVQTLAASVRAMRRASSAAEPVKTEVDKLLSDAVSLQSSGQNGEARRRLTKACSLLSGKAWDARQEYACSLALRVDRIVADTSLPFVARVAQFYAAPYRPAGGMSLRASLFNDGGARAIATVLMPERDLIEQPFGLAAELGDVPDGAYRLRAELLEAGTVLATLEQPVQLIRGIDTELAAVNGRLAKVKGHEGTKGSVRYPFQLARAINSGQRQLSQADFGIPWDAKQPPYDFTAGLRTSRELLKALEAGKDPLWRARGDHERHYWFEEAGEAMPYRVYVPLKWDGKARLPMVLVLHGNTRDHDYYFDCDDGILARMAEQHGYLVATPMRIPAQCRMGFGPAASGAGRRRTGRFQRSFAAAPKRAKG